MGEEHARAVCGGDGAAWLDVARQPDGPWEAATTREVSMRSLGFSDYHLMTAEQYATVGHRYSKSGATGDCAYGCGCWAGGWQSGGPPGIDPLGACPKNPSATAPATPLLATQRGPASEVERCQRCRRPFEDQYDLVAYEGPLTDLCFVRAPDARPKAFEECEAAAVAQSRGPDGGGYK